MKLQLAGLIVLLGICFNAYAQTACPVGVAAGSAQCGPSPTTHSLNPPAGPVEPRVRYVPSGKWRKTWGAVAIDPSVGQIGASAGMRSNKEAKLDAMTRCRRGGGTQCRFHISYENQCVVVVWPTVPGDGLLAQTGPTIEVASGLGTSKCAEKSGSECEVAYAGCSKPVFEHF